MRTVVLLWTTVLAVSLLPGILQPGAAQAPAAPLASRFGPPWPADTAPVAVHVPHTFDVMAAYAPSATAPTSGTFFVAYPAMQPWTFAGPPCKGPCEGQITLTIATGTQSDLNHHAWDFVRALRAAQQPEGSASRYAIEPVTPPPGYTQAWHKRDLHPSDMSPLPIESLVYLRAASDGTPQEFVECATVMPPSTAEPACEVSTTLDGTPAVHLSLRYRTRQWPDHEAIRTAVTRLVRTWL